MGVLVFFQMESQNLFFLVPDDDLLSPFDKM